MTNEHLKNLWPCATTVLAQCPGVGSSGTHCTACHELYSGYVALCPMHKSAHKLLIAVGEFLTIDDWSDEAIAPARIIALAQSAYEDARREYQASLQSKHGDYWLASLDHHVALNARSHATLGAALRLWQSDGDDLQFDDEVAWMYWLAAGDGTFQPLDESEIDALCEQLGIPAKPANSSD